MAKTLKEYREQEKRRTTYNNNWRKENTMILNICVSQVNDKDLLEWLHARKANGENITALVKKALREYISNHDDLSIISEVEEEKE